MATPEQVKAPSYPDNESQIVFNAMDCGYLNQAFRSAVRDLGNGDQLTWESYAEDDHEVFTVRYSGESVSTSDEVRYYKVGRWTLDFALRKKTLLMDLGENEVVRYEGEFTVPASFMDISDTVAALLNLDEYREERRAQGWDPYLDLLLRQKGLE